MSLRVNLSRINFINHTKMNPSISLMLLVFATTALSQIAVLTEFDKLLKNPVVISERLDQNQRTFRINADDSVIVRGSGFFAFLIFDTQPDHSVTTYQFWSYSKDAKLQIKGSGELYESYWEVSKVSPGGEEGPSSIVDRGSKTTIEGGLFRMEWSKGGFLYFKDGFLIERGTIGDYRELIKQQENE